MRTRTRLAIALPATLDDAIAHAHGKGAVVVAAAGNEGTALQPYKVDSSVLVVGAA